MLIIMKQQKVAQVSHLINKIKLFVSLHCKNGGYKGVTMGDICISRQHDFDIFKKWQNPHFPNPHSGTQICVKWNNMDICGLTFIQLIN